MGANRLYVDQRLTAATLPHRERLGCTLHQRRPRAEPTRGAAERRLRRPRAVVLREHVLDRTLGETGVAHRRVAGANRLLGPARVGERRAAAPQGRRDVRRDGFLPRGRHLLKARLGAVDSPGKVVGLNPLCVCVDVVQESCGRILRGNWVDAAVAYRECLLSS